MSGLDRLADPGRAPALLRVRPETICRGLVAAAVVLWATAFVAQTALLAAGWRVDGTDLLLAGLLLAVVTAAAVLGQLWPTSEAIAARAVYATVRRIEEEAGVTPIRP